MDHASAAKGHKRVGLTNALDGSEDHLICRQARACWEELRMSSLRDSEVASVKKRVEDGTLVWSREHLLALVEPFPDGDIGYIAEGQEIEGSDSDESADPWGDHGGASNDDDDDGAPAPSVSKALAAEGVVALPSDDPAEVADAKKYADRLADLERMRQTARDNKIPALQLHVEREIEKLKKQHHLGEGLTKPSAVLSRFVKAKREAEEKALAEERSKAAKRRDEQRAERNAAKKLKAEKDAVKADLEKKKAALALLPKTFSIVDFGQGHKLGGTKKHLDARVAALNRLKLRSPPLPADLDAEWNKFAVAYAEYEGKKSKAAVGHCFMEELRYVMWDLGGFLKPEPGEKSGEGGDAKASVKFILNKTKKFQKASSSVKL